MSTKRKRYRNQLDSNHSGWVLYTGTYEILWDKGIGVEVAIEGVRMRIEQLPRRLMADNQVPLTKAPRNKKNLQWPPPPQIE